MLAGAMAGIAAGGFLVALLTHLHQTRRWYVGSYEPAAALIAALGMWCFNSRGGMRAAAAGLAAALLAMLLGDTFRLMAHTGIDDWAAVPLRLLRRLWRLGSWPKLLRYAFGMYIGGYLGYAGHTTARVAAAVESEALSEQRE